MPMIKCPECGKEISDLAEKCPNCGFPIGFNINNEQPQQTNNQYQQQYETQNVKPYERKKNSTLGILALIFSALGCTFIVGVILAIVDLCKKDERKKTCSIIALCICGFWMIAGIAASSTGDSAKENSSVNSTAKTESSTEEETEQYISITSSELIDAYNENQVKCKQDYDGKLLEVTGKVSSVGTDITGTTYVCLGHDTEITFVGIQCYAKDDETINQIAELKEGDLITVSGRGECGSLSFSIYEAKIIED